EGHSADRGERRQGGGGEHADAEGADECELDGVRSLALRGGREGGGRPGLREPEALREHRRAAGGRGGRRQTGREADDRDRGAAGGRGAGGGASAGGRRCASIGARRAGGRCDSRLCAKMMIDIAPKTATARRSAALATVSFTPAAVPAWCSSAIEVITVVVSGATVMVIPKPMVRMAGKNVVQYEPPIDGTASSAIPAAATSGPTVSGMRGPMRSASAPAPRERMVIVATKGSSAAPARAGE